MARIVQHFRADTRLATLLLGAVNLALRFGWKPSLTIAERLATVAGKLVFVRSVVETEPVNGYRTLRPGRMSVRRL